MSAITGLNIIFPLNPWCTSHSSTSHFIILPSSMFFQRLNKHGPYGLVGGYQSFGESTVLRLVKMETMFSSETLLFIIKSTRRYTQKTKIYVFTALRTSQQSYSLPTGLLLQSLQIHETSSNISFLIICYSTSWC